MLSFFLVNLPSDVAHFSETAAPYLGWLALISTITFFLSLFLIPWGVSRLSSDCFIDLASSPGGVNQVTGNSFIFGLFRNILGLLLFFAGIAMLFLPGQGLLTMLFGIFLLSFPGKRTLVLSLVKRSSVQRSMDWLRTKSNKKPFNWPT